MARQGIIVRPDAVALMIHELTVHEKRRWRDAGQALRYFRRYVSSDPTSIHMCGEGLRADVEYCEDCSWGREVYALCDFPMTKDGRRCSRRLCCWCAHLGKPDHHYCPGHADEVEGVDTALTLREHYQAAFDERRADALTKRIALGVRQAWRGERSELEEWGLEIQPAIGEGQTSADVVHHHHEDIHYQVVDWTRQVARLLQHRRGYVDDSPLGEVCRIVAADAIITDALHRAGDLKEGNGVWRG